MGTYTNIIHGANATVAISSDIGYLKGPVTIGLEGDDLFVDVDSEVMPVQAFRTSKVFYCKVTVAEPTETNIATAWDETVATLGINASGAAFDPTVHASIVIVGDGAGAAAVRTITLNNGIATDFGEIVYEKASPVLLPMTFKFIKISANIGSIADV